MLRSEGVISRDTQRLKIEDLSDVEVRQGFFERLFNVGSVRVFSEVPDDPEVVLPGVRSPGTVAELIRGNMEKRRDKDPEPD